MRKWKIILLMFLTILSIGALTSCGTKETTTKELTFADVLKKVEVGIIPQTTLSKEDFFSTETITLPALHPNDLSCGNTGLYLYTKQTVKVNTIEFDVTFGTCTSATHKSDDFNIEISYGITENRIYNTKSEFIKYEPEKKYHIILDCSEASNWDTSNYINIEFCFNPSNMFCHHETHITNFKLNFTKVE